MVYEAERLIDRRFGRLRSRVLVLIASHIGATLFGAAITLTIVILIRKI